MNRERARELRNNPTDTELRLWQRLRRRQLGEHKFRRQQPVGRYIVDFVCFEKRLIVEVDGSQHSTQCERDQLRTEWLQSQGFRVLRFWDNEVWESLEEVATAIWSSLEEANPGPTLSRSKRMAKDACHSPPPQSSPVKGEEARKSSPIKEQEARRSLQSKDESPKPSPLAGEGLDGGPATKDAGKTICSSLAKDTR
jgi:very-short-patch-repair endonuclease